MKKMTVSVQVDAERLRAIQFYAGKKESSLEAELDDFVSKLYEKYVPAPTREYIESLCEPESHYHPSRPSHPTHTAAEQHTQHREDGDHNG